MGTERERVEATMGVILATYFACSTMTDPSFSRDTCFPQWEKGPISQAPQVGNGIDEIQSRILSQQLTPEERTKAHNKRKGDKHRARVEAIKKRIGREQQSQVAELHKPSFFSSNTDYSVFLALGVLRQFSV